MSFVKLDTGILDSTLWLDRDERDIFVTALLMAEPFELERPVEQIAADSLERTGFVVPTGWYGFIRAAGPGIVRRALVSAQEGIAALVRLGSPDPESRTPDFEGRRLVRVDGGYVVLNFMRYRDKDNTTAERSRRYRERQKAAEASSRRDGHADTRDSSLAEADAEAEFLSDTSPHTPPAAAVGSFEGHDNPRPASPNPTSEHAILLRKAGHPCTAYTPDLVAFVKEGGTVEHLLQVIAANNCDGKPAAYVLKIARRELSERAAPVAPGNGSPSRYSPPPARTTETVEQTRAKRDAEKPKQPASPEAVAEAIRLAREALAMPEPATRAKPDRVTAEEKTAALAELEQHKEKAA